MIGRRTFLGALVTVGPTARALAASGAPDLALVVHPSNPVKTLPAADIEAIYLGTMRGWPHGPNIVAFNYPPEHPLRVAFDRAVLKMTPQEASRYWLDQRIRGVGRPPRQVPDPNLAVRLTASLKDAITYVPVTVVNKTVRMIARITDGKVVTS